MLPREEHLCYHKRYRNEIMQIPKLAVKFLVVIGVLIVGAAGVFVWQLVALQSKPKVTTPTVKRNVVVSKVCTDDTVKQASPLMADSQTSALSDVVAKIESLSNYRGDVNCDYILTNYYTSVGNIDKAQSSLEDMRLAREAGGEYSALFDPPIGSADSLQGAIDLQKKLKSAGSDDTDAALNREMDKVK